VRLGGPVKAENPEDWVVQHLERGYKAAYMPNISHSLEAEYVASASKADITIAEVGAWSNPISKDAETSKKAIQHCQERLAFADRVRAKCCVNISCQGYYIKKSINRSS